MKYYLYIKSHCEYPDLEDEVESKSKIIAIKYFQNKYHDLSINSKSVASESEIRKEING